MLRTTNGADVAAGPILACRSLSGRPGFASAGLRLRAGWWFGAGRGDAFERPVVAPGGASHRDARRIGPVWFRLARARCLPHALRELPWPAVLCARFLRAAAGAAGRGGKPMDRQSTPSLPGGLSGQAAGKPAACPLFPEPGVRSRQAAAGMLVTIARGAISRTVADRLAVP